MRQIIKSASAKIRLKKAYDDAEIVPFDLSSKFVIMSDCHRGQGNNDDNFLSNQNLFFAALDHYYKNGFTYIELGDGDELWENRRLEPIISCHSDAFWLMSSFYRENRFYMLYGNHDAAKRREGFIKKHFGDYYCDSANCRLPLFPGIKIHKSLILEASDLCESGKTIRLFLVHGHQGSLLNDALWPLARFLVRYIWGPLEMIGFSAPTGSGRPEDKKDRIEQSLASFAESRRQIMIAGHTHRPAFPSPGEGFYFNDGSCVHPRCITAIEIYGGKIVLVKWYVTTKDDRTLFVDRQILAGPVLISDYYAKPQNGAKRLFSVDLQSAAQRRADKRAR